MGIEGYVVHFGYVVILLATFFAGEAILVLAGFMAHRGYLSFWGVVLTALIGSLTSDQIYFYLGRKKACRIFINILLGWRSRRVSENG